MPLQPPQYLGNLDSTNPRGTDSRTISDDVHRNTKESSRMSFPNVTGEVTSAHGDLNLLSGLAASGAKVMTGVGGATVALFANPTAPTGWTIVTTFDSRAVFVKGTINGQAIAGGDIAGSDDPGIMDKVPSHTHPVVTPAHTHLTVDSTVSTDDGLTNSTVLAMRRNEGNDDDYRLRGNSPSASANVAITGPANDGGSGVTGANTGASNYTPKFAGVIACQLNA